MAIHHHETQSLLNRVVGGLDVGIGDEAKIAFAMEAEARGQIVDEAVDFAFGIAVGFKNRLQRGIVDFGFSLSKRQDIVCGAQFVAPMQDLEESLKLGQESFSVPLNRRFRIVA